ncbi:metallophosphoesterase family protein [Clostridium sp. ZS2-4]|uniref:metallophosphoesterase family protein n=1 Tax=Clostridium sp. ZS2-4 TaxID=2987703 RepID=UPI00227AE1AD|nr:DNA repair exonuclease [Clostridium sp. ZS2-4]MCY6355023.1 DNA repair exonuclease [Clostridium sp. ZS2-4]
MKELINHKLRFIHAADIHLGSVLHTNYEGIKEFETIFKDAVYEAFERICSCAIKYEVDFMLLSGDTYDMDIRTVRSRELFYKQCIRLQEHNIHVYMIRGNHDPYEKSEGLFNLPQNVHVFDSEEAEILEVYKNQRLVSRILGQSYRGKWEGRKMVNSYKPLDNSVYNIGLLHTQLEAKNKKYVPCTLEELKEKENINYWALGHIHKCKLINCVKPVIAYSGIPQGRDMGEEGVGGCLLVEVNEDFSSSISFLPASSVVWRKVTLNIDECKDKKPSNLSELEEIILEKGQTILDNIPNLPEDLKCTYPVSEIIRGYVVQWSIEGRGEIDEILREDEENISQYLIKTLNSHFMDNNLFMYTDSVEINTRMEILDIENLRKTNMVFQEIDKIIQDIFQDENMNKDIVNTFGGVFEKKYDKEDFNQEKIQLDEKIIEEIIRAAGEIVIEKLVEKGEEG